MILVPPQILRDPSKMWENKVTATDYRDTRFNRSGGTYMPLSINARRLSYIQKNLIFASDQYLENVPAVSYSVKFEPFPIIHLYDKEHLRGPGTRIHSTAYWKLSLNEVKRHNLKSNILLKDTFGQKLFKVRDYLREITFDCFDIYLANMIDLSEFTPENFLEFLHDHRNSSTGGKYTYGSFYESTKSGRRLTPLGIDAFDEAKKFVIRYLTTKYSQLRRFINESLFYKTELRFSALRVREDTFDMTKINSEMRYEKAKFRDRVANGIRGNVLGNIGLYGEGKKNLRLCYLAVKDYLQKLMNIQIFSPVTDGVDAYLEVFSWKSRFYCDISTADKQMPLFSWALDTTSYGGYGNESSIQAIAESSGGNGTSISNLVYAVNLLFAICWINNLKLPSKCAIFGDNIAFPIKGNEDLITLLRNDASVKLFLEETDRWLGMHKTQDYPQGIKICVDSADKRLGFKDNMTSYILQQEEVDLNKATAVLLSKNILVPLGGPSFKQLLEASKQSINGYLVSKFEMHHHLDKIVHDEPIFQKARQIVSAYQDIFFGQYNDSNVKQTEALKQ